MTEKRILFRGAAIAFSLVLLVLVSSAFLFSFSSEVVVLNPRPMNAESPPVRQYEAPARIVNDANVPPPQPTGTVLILSGAKGYAKFDQSNDLYRLAVEAIGSNDFHVIHNGWQAAGACTSFQYSRQEVEKILAELPVGLQGSRRRVALSQLISKCLGFMNNDAVANQALRRQLSEKLRAQNANYVFGLKDTPPSEAQFFAILDSADWASFSGLLRSHGAMVAKSLGLTGGAEELLVGIAWNIASCDLGRDCTQAGLSYVIQCAGNGRCPESVQQDMRVGLTAEQVERVEVFRKTIVNAAAARDGGFFGY